MTESPGERKPPYLEQGARLKEAMDKAGKKQREIAARLGISEQAVSQWVRGLSSPDIRKMVILARFLDVTLDWIREGRPPDIGGQIPRLIAQSIPIVDRVQAARWLAAGATRSDIDAFPVDPTWRHVFAETEAKLSVLAFALQIVGRSMLPDFQVGDLVIIDPEIEPLPGDFVVAHIASKPAATFRRYRRAQRQDGRLLDDQQDDPAFDLMPINPDWPIETVNSANPGRIVGTMVEHRSYRPAPKPRFGVFPLDPPTD